MSLKLTKDQISKILDNVFVFKMAQRLTGVPWEAVAALWMRESFSVAPPDRVGGQFQFDPPLQRNQMKQLLDRFVLPGSCTQEVKDAIVKCGQSHFQSAAVLAACFLRHKAAHVLTPDADDEAIKDAFYGYNGRKYGSVDKSPYVMNGFDAEHMNMRLRGTVPDKRDPSKRVWVDIIDKRPGAFTVYKQLVALDTLKSAAHGCSDQGCIHESGFHGLVAQNVADDLKTGAVHSEPGSDSSPDVVGAQVAQVSASDDATPGSGDMDEMTTLASAGEHPGAAAGDFPAPQDLDTSVS